MPENLEPPNYVFQKWKKAYYALDYAIQNFLGSTIALQSCLSSSTHSAEALIVRDSLAETWLDDPPILDKDSQLSQAQSHLNQIRNSLLSINVLPLEILLGIFRFASFDTFHSQYNTPIPFTYRQDNYRDLVVLTHVCSSWRRILLGTPTFWSRFLLDPKYPLVGECERARVYSSRAHGVPQSLSIYEQLNHRYFNLRRSDALVKIIQPRLSSLTQMALLNFEDTRLVKQAVKLWLSNGKPGYYELLTDLYGSAARAQWAESMLSPIRVLSLRGMVFAWDSPVYWNLVVLRIGNIHQATAPTIGEMLGILLACPLLHTLRLYGMAIRPGDPAIPLQNVYPTELVDLNLAVLSPKSMGLLLTSIFPQHKDLSLRIACPAWDTQAFGVVCPFLARTNITRLFIEQFDAPEPGDVIGRFSACYIEPFEDELLYWLKPFVKDVKFDLRWIWLRVRLMAPLHLFAPVNLVIEQGSA
ncbi:hypothetical protein B0J17DRAFT_632639 [Rhizoctonia solani]|nr:hypothetical protein B0J17DRAFT_632639 [Rhizoctonia solani]